MSVRHWWTDFLKKQLYTTKPAWYSTGGLKFRQNCPLHWNSGKIVLNIEELNRKSLFFKCLRKKIVRSLNGTVFKHFWMNILDWFWMTNKIQSEKHNYAYHWIPVRGMRCPLLKDYAEESKQCTVGARILNARNPNLFEIRTFFCSVFEWSTIWKPNIRKPTFIMAALD